MPESSERTEKTTARGGNDASRAQGEEAAAATGGEGQREATTDAAATRAAEPLDERLVAALHAAGDKKALNPIALDLREVASFTDYFLIVSGTNVRQVQAIADEVVEQLRKQHGVKPARMEGYNTAEWILLDYGDFIFHVFEEKSRRFYDLERLWRDASRVPLPPELEGGAEAGGGGSLRTGQ